MAELFNLDAVENAALKPLKDFQRMTVDRIYDLYRAKHNRVLVADEVGMGKTVIARGVIARTARIRKVYEHDDLFKVAYVCSNQNIANQNISKLRIVPAPPKREEDRYRDDISEMRLSMQHLRVTEDENNPDVRANYIQLIPLTPETSFRMSGGCGTARERALMAVILSRMPELSAWRKQITEELCHNVAAANWRWMCDFYQDRVNECSRITKGEYPKNVLRALTAHRSNVVAVVEWLIGKGEKPIEDISVSSAIRTLRMAFAEISVEMLNPDLVIMDEFQRYKFLLEAEDGCENETNILAKRFLASDKQDRRVLLLSATPFKYYETLCERQSEDGGGAYKEFFDLVDFLFGRQSSEVKTLWQDYSARLQQLSHESGEVLFAKKQDAQDALYGGMCRTERVSVMESADYTLDEKKPIQVVDDDIAAYVQFSRLLKSADIHEHLPTGYAKSCPYLMSFMIGYKLKEDIDEYFKRHLPELEKAKKGCDRLWMNRRVVNPYRNVRVKHARLELLRKHAFMDQADKYLWVPPTKPYYKLQGVYKDNGTGNASFSKILVFSAWEMVPRMIATLLSYEAEQRTIVKRYKQERGKDLKRLQYFDKYRYPARRLLFAVKEGQPAGMSILTLLYPSKTLAGFYDPVDSFNRGLTLQQIEQKVASEVRRALRPLRHYAGTSGRSDNRWYYLAPMLLDGLESALKWAQTESMKAISVAHSESDDEEASTVKKGLRAHIDELVKELSSIEESDLGPMPDEEDLVGALVDMAIASPAVCAFRSNGSNRYNATELSAVFIQAFNTPSATAIVDLATGRFHDDASGHWRNVLRYCKDGCFQGMLDEYRAVLSDEIEFLPKAERQEALHRKMCSSLILKSAPCAVDTYESMCSRVAKHKAEREDSENKQMRMRTHYAVGFIKGKAQDSKAISRKENIRAVFNSPLRPFVLASTSIGQEGLDFHPYCRKVFHWNLPNNPVDLEQREGRINRYKCLAVRQNVADSYDPEKDGFPTNDLWSKMYEAAERRERGPDQSALVPFWCFGKNQTTRIERIVPLYPFSKDVAAYERLVRILSYYRLALGQPRQEELLEHVLNDVPEAERAQLKRLFIDLSPFSRRRKDAE